MSELLRTFIAVDINRHEVLSELGRAVDLLVETGADLKPVSVENMHITIRFIGEVPMQVVNSICSELSKMEFSSFKVRVRGVGVFPNISRPRVIWAGITSGVEELTRIHEVAESFLRRLGFEPDREKFVPHITLARLRSNRNLSKLVKVLNDVVMRDFGEFVVDEVVLKRSILTPSGPIYSNICSVKAKRT